MSYEWSDEERRRRLKSRSDRNRENDYLSIRTAPRFKIGLDFFFD